MIFMSWKILSFAHMLAKQRFRYKLIKKIGIYCMTLGIFTALFPKFLSLQHNIVFRFPFYHLGNFYVCQKIIIHNTV